MIFTLVAFTAVLMSTEQANATIRRVGYFGTPVANVDYTDLQLAHNNSAAGDTILVFPGDYTATYSKKIVTIGYGYFTEQNLNLQVITGTSSVYITLNTGSNASIFQGISGLIIDNSNSAATISDITINRCNVSSIYLYGSAARTYSNWQFTQSCINGFVAQEGLINNWLVSNCYIASFSMKLNSAQSCLFLNNIFFNYSSDFGNANVVVQNTIFLGNRINALAATYQNCISSSTYPLPTGNGNQNITGTQINNLFVGYPTQSTFSNDGRWVLKAGSLAIGTGVGGTDCGIFGGATPYVLSGIPAIPAFYKLTAPSINTGANPYTITFSVRSNN